MTKQNLLLVIKTIAGDREAFETLLQSQKSLIRWLIRRRTDCPEDAEDIHQEVSLKIYQHIATLKCPEAFSSWLRTIVVRECARYFDFKKRCVHIEPILELENHCVETDSDCIPALYTERLEFCAALESAIESLQEPKKRLFNMRYRKGMCCSDIAASTGLKTGTVSVKIFRTKKQLWKILRSSRVET